MQLQEKATSDRCGRDPNETHAPTDIPALSVHECRVSPVYRLALRSLAGPETVSRCIMTADSSRLKNS
jgi:hypothetical protein